MKIGVAMILNFYFFFIFFCQFGASSFELF